MLSLLFLRVSLLYGFIYSIAIRAWKGQGQLLLRCCAGLKGKLYEGTRAQSLERDLLCPETESIVIFIAALF